MSENKKDIEFIDQKKEGKELKKTSIKEFIDGSFLTRTSVVNQLPFIVFCVSLAILYIANKYHAEYMLRKTYKLKDEIEELRAESITTASELMFASRQSQVFKMVETEGLGLKESRVPPVRIRMKD
jgi:cell division protein FtsL